MVQVLNRFDLKKIFKLLLLLLVANVAVADKDEKFEFMDQLITFEKKSKSGSCSTEILSPELIIKDNPKLASKMNAHIDNFIKNCQFCNSKTKSNHYKTTYEIIKSSDSVMSLKFTTKHNNKIVHMDALNLNAENGKIVDAKQVFEPFSKNFIPAIISLSNNHLTKDITWTQFLDKVKHRSIQYYMSNSDWYLIFNSAIDLGKEPFIVKVPKSFFEVKS